LENAHEEPAPRTLAELPRHGLELGDGRVALIHESSKTTFEDLESAERATAAGLIALGIARGERVAILLPNLLEYVHAYFGIPLAGAVTVPINTFLSPTEVAVVLADSRSRCLVTTRRRLATLAPHIESLPHLDTVILVEGEEGQVPPIPARVRRVAWEDLPEVATAAALPRPASPDDVAVLTYTSGTTGRMKGVVLTHANLMANARSCLAAVKLRKGDRLLLFLPMFHSLTQLVCVIVPRLAALPVILLPGIDRSAIKAAIRKHRPTIFLAVPAIYAAMAEHPPGLLLRTFNPIRLYICGGAPLDMEVMRRFEAGWRRPLCEGYGLSEAAPVVSLNPVDGERRAGSVGVPLPGVTVRIARDGGGEAAPDEVGEIEVRGKNVMAGYHERPEETAAVLKDGWLRTGDLGRVDRDGYIYIAGRRKELLIFRGMNVYPREIEEVLSAHSAVAEAAVVGLPDPKRGDVPHAAVALRAGSSATESDLRTHCRERLARYKVPRSILLMDRLPRNATGKVVKETVREAIRTAGSRGATPPDEPDPTGA
jgi:long-chain acyl-CoA synthetase